MNKVTYERLKMDVTQFETEDVITTSEEIWTPPAYFEDSWEQTNGYGPANGD